MTSVLGPAGGPPLPRGTVTAEGDFNRKGYERFPPAASGSSSAPGLTDDDGTCTIAWLAHLDDESLRRTNRTVAYVICALHQDG